MLKKTIVTSLVTGSLILTSAAGVFADTGVGIVGNGDGSQNTVVVSQSNTTSVGQSNSTSVSNTVTSTANTGDNHVGGNTGGNNSIDTGNATSSNTVTNVAGSNTANVSNCGCADGNLTAVISGNGANSDSHVTRDALTVGVSNATSLSQGNSTNFANTLTSSNFTGDNSMGGNTSGTNQISTGNAKSTNVVTNVAGSNSATVGGGASAGAGVAGGTTAEILGNGDGSQNSLTLGQSNTVTVGQSNTTSVTNRITSLDATGLNRMGGNTGSALNSIMTGDATASNIVTNTAGFNALDASNCGCQFGANNLYKVGQNGDGSANALLASFTNALVDSQGNTNSFSNPVTSSLFTGDNRNGGNTAGVLGGMIDPNTVSTGNAKSDNIITNQGGVNTLGAGATVTLPGNLGSVEVGANFNQVWAAFSAAWTAWAATL